MDMRKETIGTNGCKLLQDVFHAAGGMVPSHILRLVANNVRCMVWYFFSFFPSLISSLLFSYRFNLSLLFHFNQIISSCCLVHSFEQLTFVPPHLLLIFMCLC
jgi:hypothetical protein